MATTTKSPTGSTPGALEVKVQNALNGVQQALPTGSKLALNGASMTQAQLATQLSEHLPVFEAVPTAKQPYTQAITARKAMEPAARTFLVQLRAALIAQFGRTSPLLQQFGMGTGTRATPSPQTKVLAAAKAALTRQKRGTTSKKQKQSITVVSPPSVTLGQGAPQISPPTVDATAPGSAAQPAASAAAATPSPDSAPAKS